MQSRHGRATAPEATYSDIGLLDDATASTDDAEDWHADSPHTTTSPTSNGTSNRMADEGLSLIDSSDPSWNGKLKLCCCCGDANTQAPPRITKKPESPRLEAVRASPLREQKEAHGYYGRAWAATASVSQSGSHALCNARLPASKRFIDVRGDPSGSASAHEQSSVSRYSRRVASETATCTPALPVQPAATAHGRMLPMASLLAHNGAPERQDAGGGRARHLGALVRVLQQPLRVQRPPCSAVPLCSLFGMLHEQPGVGAGVDANFGPATHAVRHPCARQSVTLGAVKDAGSAGSTISCSAALRDRKLAPEGLCNASGM